MGFCKSLLIVLAITSEIDSLPAPKEGMCRSNQCDVCVSNNCIWLVTSLDDGDCKPAFGDIEGDLHAVVTYHTRELCERNLKCEPMNFSISTYLLLAAGAVITVGFSAFLYYYKKGRLSKRNMDRLVKTLPKVVQPVAAAAVEIVKSETTVPVGTLIDA